MTGEEEWILRILAPESSRRRRKETNNIPDFVGTSKLWLRENPKKKLRPIRDSVPTSKL